MMLTTLSKHYHKLNAKLLLGTSRRTYLSIAGFTILSVLAGHYLSFGYGLHLAIVAWVLFVLRRKFSASKSVFLIILTMVTMTIAATGWFYSPLFFGMYLLVLMYGFVFGIKAALVYSLIAIILFIPELNKVDFGYGLWLAVSILVPIPIVVFINKQVFRLRH